jgi:hypothetical protein
VRIQSRFWLRMHGDRLSHDRVVWPLPSLWWFARWILTARSKLARVVQVGDFIAGNRHGQATLTDVDDQGPASDYFAEVI